MTHAIILAAGRGSRMGQLTDDQPKCFTPMRGKPLIEWQLTALRQAGIAEIAVVRGYQANFWDHCGLRIDHYFDNPRWGQTNMVASLACAAQWLREGTCIVSYSDIYYEASAVSLLLEAKSEIGITYDPHWHQRWSKRFKDPLSDAETFRLNASGLVEDIGRRPQNLDEVQGQYMGLLRFTPAGWLAVERLLASGTFNPDKLDMTTLLRHLVHAGVPVAAYAYEREWAEVDSVTDLAVAEKGNA